MERFFFWLTERDQRGSDYFYYNKIAPEWWCDSPTTTNSASLRCKSKCFIGWNLYMEKFAFKSPQRLYFNSWFFLRDNSECPAWKDYGNTNYHRYVQNIFQNELIHWIGASLFLLLSCVFFLSFYDIVEAYDPERFVPPREFELQRRRVKSSHS